MYAIAIATAAAAMAASVPLRNVPLLALGALAMFSYVTTVAVRYLHESLGVPSALAVTGVLIIGLAVVSARLMRAVHPPQAQAARRRKASTRGTSHRARRGKAITPGPSQGLVGRRSARHETGQPPPVQAGSS